MRLLLQPVSIDNERTWMDFNVHLEAKQMLDTIDKSRAIRRMYYIGLLVVSLFGFAALINAIANLVK